MKIGVDCPGCQASFQVEVRHAGKLGRCPTCKERVRVPQHQPESGPKPNADPWPTARVRADPPRDAARTEPVVDVDGDGEETYGLANEAATVVSARVRAAKAARAQPKVAEAAPGDPVIRTSKRTREPKEILAGFRGEIEPVRPTLLYRFWIVVIAAFMVILPLIYLGLIGVVGMAVYWHAANNLIVFKHVRQIQAALVLYVGPLVVGVVVLGFMLKPFFAKATKRSKVRKLDPDKEPLIVAFVDGVCASVGAPTPSRIEVNCEVNASAHLASWVLSPSKELVLTIGLPLVAGLTLRQFTGVLAHEFGHFSQGAGMRLTVLIRSINLWFARVVYERDSWDEDLVARSSDGNWMVMVVALLARASVWATRRILWVFMHVARLVSGFLSRQMEFDADRYETRMVGGKTFEATSGRLRVLSVASQIAHNDLGAHWRERRLPDDLSRLILIKIDEFPEPLVQEIRDEARARKAGLFDTHPSDYERIARALAEDTRGIFRLEGPATDLFRDFDALSRASTFDYYRSMLGREVSKEQLYPMAEAVLNKEVEREGDLALGRFFLAALELIQPFPLPDAYPKPPQDPKEAKRRLGDLRRAMLARRDASMEAGRRWNEANGRMSKAEAALSLFKADKMVKASLVELPKATVAAAEAARASALASTEAIMAELGPFATLAAERMALALGLLELDLVVRRVPDGEVLRDEARALYPSAAILGGRVVGELGSLIAALAALGFLFTLYQAGKNEKDQAMINALLRGARLIHDRLTALKWKIGDSVPYPFEHAHDGITLGRFVLPSVPDSQEIGDIIEIGIEAQGRVIDLHRRVLGRLAATAEAVERAIGLLPVEVS